MKNQNSTLSFIGIGIGAVAFMIALVHFWAGPFNTQPPLEQTVAEKAIAIKKATIAALKGEKPANTPTRHPMDWDRVADLATAVLGGLAIILGVFGFARAEPLRIAGGAAVLGGVALAFQFAILALGAIVLAIVLAAVVSGMS